MIDEIIRTRTYLIPFPGVSLNHAYITLRGSRKRHLRNEYVEMKRRISLVMSVFDSGENWLREFEESPPFFTVDYTLFFPKGVLLKQDGYPKGKDVTNMFKIIEDGIFEYLSVWAPCSDSHVMEVRGRKVEWPGVLDIALPYCDGGLAEGFVLVTLLVSSFPTVDVPEKTERIIEDWTSHYREKALRLLATTR